MKSISTHIIRILFLVHLGVAVTLIVEGNHNWRLIGYCGLVAWADWVWDRLQP